MYVTQLQRRTQWKKNNLLTEVPIGSSAGVETRPIHLVSIHATKTEESESLKATGTATMSVTTAETSSSGIL
jgi:hypothetical protein